MTMKYSDQFLPPLRIILTNDCNGRCFYCHNEGNLSPTCHSNISFGDIEKIVLAIKKIPLKKLHFSGGEPTLHPDFEHIVRFVRKSCPDLSIGITTNGSNMSQIRNTLNCFDRITVSISSFIPSVYQHYVNINPTNCLEELSSYSIVQKAVSIVITPVNIAEIPTIIHKCVQLGITVKLLFPINVDKDTTLEQKEHLINLILNEYGDFYIRVGPTPMLVSNYRHVEIRIKLPKLSALVQRKICDACVEEPICAERVCAVRVYPNKSVTPCLSNVYKYSSNDVYTNIIDTYGLLGQSRAQLDVL